jgi:hypothetical protein
LFRLRLRLRLRLRKTLQSKIFQFDIKIETLRGIP